MTYADAWLSEMWAPVREYHEAVPSVIPTLYTEPRNGDVLCHNESGPAGASTPVTPALTPDYTGGST